MLEQKPQNRCSHRLESQSASESVSAASLYDNQKTCISGHKQSTPANKQSDQAIKHIFHLNGGLGFTFLSI